MPSEYREPDIRADHAERLEAALAAEMARQNGGMAQTTREKQEAFRARQALLGLKEVRGIFLPESLHPVIKEQAAKLLEKHKPKDKK